MPGAARSSLQTIIEELLARTGATRTTLRLDTPGRNFPAVAEALAPGAVAIAQDESIDQRGAATAQWLLRELRPLVQDDVLVDGPRPPQGLLDAYGVRAQMLGPIVREGQLIGWISVHQAGEPRRWSAGDVEALELAMSRVRAALSAEEDDLELQGLHHVTMITADAQRTVDTYAEVLGLRLVKTTVNFDDPGAYHLYFGDEDGAPGSILTWFEYRSAGRGTAGAGMVHTIQLGVPDAAALDFWARRLAAFGIAGDRSEGSLRFRDGDGLPLELAVADLGNRPLRAVHPDVPAAVAITGVEGARAYALEPDLGEPLLDEVLGFVRVGNGEFTLAGGGRTFRWGYDAAAAPGRSGAGTVHHIAWASRDEELIGWLERTRQTGARVTPVQDRDYFRSIYFREPRGTLFEIATLAPGFATDEAPDRLGEELRVPSMHAGLRPQIERTLTPLVNPRVARRAGATA